MENELEAQLKLQMDSNEKLDDISKTNEAHLVETSNVKDAVKDLERTAEVIALNTQPKEVQKIEIQTGDENEIAKTFWQMLRGQKGEKGDKGDKGDAFEYKDFTKEHLDKLKGEKGEPGIDGLDGQDGKTPTRNELVDLIKPLIPEPIKGKDGKDGIDGVNGKDGKNGKDGSPDTPEEIAKKLNTLTKSIDWKVLKNVPDMKGGGGFGSVITDGTTITGSGLYDDPLRVIGGGGSLSNITGLIEAGDNITLSGTGTTEDPYIINSLGGGGEMFIDQTPDNGTYDLLIGDVDGVNTTFTVSQGEYPTGKLIVALNGQIMEQGATEDFVETDPDAGTFDFIIAPQIGDVVTAFYSTGTGGGGGGTSLDLEVEGTPNIDQTLLNLVAGTNMTITDNGDGSVTFDATGGSGSGDMEASVYDPANGARQVAFNDELFSGDYDDLSNKPTLGTMAAEDADDYILDTEKGANNGVATLDSGGKIPSSQLPSTVMEFKGTWNASTNTPTLTNGTGDAGDVYLTSTGGTVNFGAGNITFAQGDWVVYNGTIWEKSINSNAVVSVNGQQGVVVLDADDIDDTSTTNKFVTSTDLTKLSNLSGTNTGDQDLSGLAAKAQTFDFTKTFVGVGANGTYILKLKIPYAGTITETTSICSSGTATAQFKINSTNLGGTANSVSSSEQSQSHASANTFSSGDDIVVEITSASSLENMTLSVTFTRTLA
jgi:hypothetical protein